MSHYLNLNHEYQQFLNFLKILMFRLIVKIGFHLLLLLYLWYLQNQMTLKFHLKRYYCYFQLLPLYL